MTKPWQIMPWLAVAALAISAWWWQQGKNAWHAPPPRAPELPAVADIALPSAGRAQQALERPLLWTSRRPVNTGGPQGGQAQELMESQLTAVFSSGGQQIAVFRRKDGSILKLGADTAPWRLASFDGRKAVFISGDQQLERLLEHAAPPAPKPAPGRPSPLANQ